MRSLETLQNQNNQPSQPEKDTLTAREQGQLLINIANAIESTDPQKAMRLRKSVWSQGDDFWTNIDD